MKVYFDTREFESSHSRQPRGLGSWLFELTHWDGEIEPRPAKPDDLTVWVNGKTYVPAKLEAVRRFREFGIVPLEIKVLS